MSIDHKPSMQRWESEGGATGSSPVCIAVSPIENAPDRLSVVPHIDHKRPPDEDGTRRSPNPIHADYSADLWTSHTRSGGVPSLVRSKRRVGGRNDCEKLG